MKPYMSLAFLALGLPWAVAQSPTAQPSTSSALPAANSPSSDAAILAELDRLQSAAGQASRVLGHMRIDKWKADVNSKQQAQANSDSVQRNLDHALPGMISDVRSAPANLSAELKLYRNVNALYDVLASVTESAGAFGPKGDYDALEQELEVFDSVRRTLGDSVEQLAAGKEAQIAQLQNQVKVAQAAAAAAANPPKKVIVDDAEPAKKGTPTSKKKTASKKATQNASADDPNAPSGESKQE